MSEQRAGSSEKSVKLTMFSKPAKEKQKTKITNIRNETYLYMPTESKRYYSSAHENLKAYVK